MKFAALDDTTWRAKRKCFAVPLLLIVSDDEKIVSF